MLSVPKFALLSLTLLAFAPAQPAPRIVIDYPQDGSVFPPDFAPPTFLWRDSDAAATAWELEIAFPDGAPAMRLTARGEPMSIGEIDPRCVAESNQPPKLTPEQAAAHSWKPDPAAWSLVKQRSAGRPATVTISGSGGARAQVHISTSKDPVGAPIFYRDVPLMPSEVEKGVIKPIIPSAVPLVGWRLRNVAETRSRLVMEGLPTCANCHSFSKDGKTLALDVDGPQNDKGTYAIVSLAPQTSIRTEDVFTWNDFPDKPPGQRTIGFMAQLSPDARYAVTTVNEDVFVDNFKDYRFLQVFYPTRGILAWYDRATRRIRGLPGADNPNFVQTNGFWSPDGKYLVFARAGARDAYPEGRGMAQYAGDPLEPPIQYDLYRLPFNGGKGGRPTAIAGASGNHMSNSFPKVSPDGRWIVFVQSRNGQLMRPDGQLYIVPAEGGQARRMRCNTALMNSWHSFSPNGRWLVFSSKSRSPYTQMFLTHIDEEGNDSPAILIENSTASNRAVNIPEFVNMAPSGIDHIDTPAVDFYKQFDVAAALAKKGQYAAAIPEWTKAVQMSPTDARALNNFGQTLAHAGKTQEAIGEYRKAILVKANYPEAHNNLAIALAAAGHPKEAVEHYKAAIEGNPGYAEAHSNLGRVLAEQGHLDAAIAEYQAALQINPQYAEAHNNMGFALAAQGHLPEAESEYNQAIEDDPKYAHAYNNLGLVLAMQGKVEDAIGDFTKAIELDPADAGAEGNLGHALLSKDKVDEAIPHLKRALELGPQAAEVQTNLGVALAEKGLTDEAIPHFERALQLAPDSADAHYSLGMALVM